MRKVKFLLLMVGVLVLVFSLMPATYADEQVPTIELSPATGGQDDCGCAAQAVKNNCRPSYYHRQTPWSPMMASCTLLKKSKQGCRGSNLVLKVQEQRRNSRR